jgi:hypothetical protein
MRFLSALTIIFLAASQGKEQQQKRTARAEATAKTEN